MKFAGAFVLTILMMIQAASAVICTFKVPLDSGCTDDDLTTMFEILHQQLDTRRALEQMVEPADSSNNNNLRGAVPESERDLQSFDCGLCKRYPNLYECLYTNWCRRRMMLAQQEEVKEGDGDRELQSNGTTNTKGKLISALSTMNLGDCKTTSVYDIYCTDK